MMTITCQTCGEELEFETKAWHPNDPRAVEAADRVFDEHERVHWA